MRWAAWFSAVMCGYGLSQTLAHAQNPPPSPKPAWHSLDVLPDCREKKITADELVKLAEKPDLTMLDFLNSIPGDTLQTFTFVPGTRSSQHHLVDEKWPRVLRASADGKLAMSFVCNPESVDYGSVEILHFDDKNGSQWRSMSLNFEKRDIPFFGLTEEKFRGGKHPRIERDSAACLKCHGVGAKRDSLRPIFSAYPEWPGFFGSEDDTIFVGEREYAVFQQFKSTALQNACFQTLPWPKKVPPGYEHYPYHALKRPDREENIFMNERYIRELKTANYHVRPNLKFTDTFSHLLAIRLKEKLMSDKRFLRAAPLVAMETLSCEGIDLDAELSKIYGRSYKKPKFGSGMDIMDPRSENSQSLRLYTVASLLGVTPDEWTLEFNSGANPTFATGVQGAYGRDNSVARLTQSLLLQALSDSFPEMKTEFRLSRGVSAFFAGQDFSCIDDLGGAVEFDSAENQKKMCTVLKRAHFEKWGDRTGDFAATTKSSGHVLATKIDGKAVTEGLAKVLNGLSTDGKVSGAKAVQTYCYSCHGPDSYLPEHFRFFTSDKHFRKAVQQDPMLLFRMMSYTESGRMPLGHGISENERRTIQKHLLKLSGGKP